MYCKGRGKMATGIWPPKKRMKKHNGKEQGPKSNEKKKENKDGRPRARKKKKSRQVIKEDKQISLPTKTRGPAPSRN